MPCGPLRIEYPRSSPCLDEFGKGHPFVAAHDGVVVHRAFRTINAHVRRREPEDPVAQRGARTLDSVAGHEKPCAGEGSGVKTVPIGVGLHEMNT